MEGLSAIRKLLFGRMPPHNQFHGPGLWNIDLSVSRAFPLHFLGDAGRLLLSADLYNSFNNANLNKPDNT